MAVSLSKGGNVSLTKEAPGLKDVRVGLGWDSRVTDGAGFDLDASAFLLGSSGRVRNDSDFIFYNNLTSTDGAVRHLGDSITPRRAKSRRMRPTGCWRTRWKRFPAGRRASIRAACCRPSMPAWRSGRRTVTSP